MPSWWIYRIRGRIIFAMQIRMHFMHRTISSESHACWSEVRKLRPHISKASSVCTPIEFDYIFVVDKAVANQWTSQTEHKPRVQTKHNHIESFFHRLAEFTHAFNYPYSNQTQSKRVMFAKLTKWRCQSFGITLSTYAPHSIIISSSHEQMYQHWSNQWIRQHSMHSFSKSNDRLRDCVPLMPCKLLGFVHKMQCCWVPSQHLLTSSSSASISILRHMDSVRCISCVGGCVRHVVKMPSQTTTDMWTFEARIFIW